MLSLKRTVKDFPKRYCIGVPIFVVLALSLVPFRVAIAQQPGQTTFSTPEEASHALFVAVQKDDKKALSGILGPDAKQLISLATTSRTSLTGRTLLRNIRKCIGWLTSRMERPPYTSVHRIGLRRFHS